MAAPVPAGTAGLMGEACEAFEAILEVLDGRAGDAGQLVTAYVMAGGAAADARDALLTAPGTPPPAASEGHPLPLPGPGRGLEEVADALAGAARVLAARLAGAVASAGDPRDRDALIAASRAAFAVHGYLTGTGQWPPGR